MEFKPNQRDLIFLLLGVGAGMGIGKGSPSPNNFERVYTRKNISTPEIVMARMSVEFGRHYFLRVHLSDGTEQDLLYVPGTFPEIFVVPDPWTENYFNFNPAKADKLDTVGSDIARYEPIDKPI